MIRCLLLIVYAIAIDAIHFNGGTITWMPVDPYDNSSSVEIIIIQSYSWTYPLMTCANNVPISTSGRSNENTNLTCVVDCSTDGGYSLNPINILTDCTSVSPSLGMMTSQRSNNVTLNATAHFYLAYVGDAWRALNYPSQRGLQWSIVSLIDLRMRPDGFINTPPVASIVSPQYVLVNRTTQIVIPVSDVNAGDDVRCRWSIYISGIGRRRRSDEEERTNQEHATQHYKTIVKSQEILLTRRKRSKATVTVTTETTTTTTTATTDTTTTATTDTTTTATTDTTTTATTADTTTTTITTDTSTTTTTDTTTTTITTTTTTVDTPATLRSTSSYPIRQAIDECGDICYPSSLPNGTILSDCTLSLTGLRSGVWYAVAIQVEDFINTTSGTAMSSVPVQFLIYVMPPPACSNPPVIMPLTGCLEVSVNVSKSFNIYVLNSCGSNISNITSIFVSSQIAGMQESNLTQVLTNTSLYYVTFAWTPQENQIGEQQLCVVSYTDKQIQSQQYCVTFTVISSTNVCETTTTTSTTTPIPASTTSTTSFTSTSTSSTSSTLTTASSTSSTSATTTSTTSSTSSTSTSTSSTSSTSATTTTTTSTTSSTSTTTSSTSSTTTTTTSTTSTTSSTSTSTSTTTSTSTSTTSSTSSTSTSTSTTTSTSTSTTSSTSSTSTSTSTTSSATTTTSSTSTTTSATSTTQTTTTSVTTIATTTTAGEGTSWGLIAGISSVALPLALCACCCLYQLLWSPSARRQRQQQEDAGGRYNYLTSSTETMAQTITPNTNENIQIEVLKKSYKVYNIHSPQNNANNVSSSTECEGSILVAIYNNTNAKRIDSGPVDNTEQSFEMKQNSWMPTLSEEVINGNISNTDHATPTEGLTNRLSNFKPTGRRFGTSRPINNQKHKRSVSTPSFNANELSVFHSSSETAFGTELDPNLNSSLTNSTDWIRLYIFGRKNDTEVPRISRPS